MKSIVSNCLQIIVTIFEKQFRFTPHISPIVEGTIILPQSQNHPERSRAMAKRQTEKITALYERLSHDDDQAGDSNSIVNQKKYLEDYARKNGFSQIVHFTDDGYSGTNFNRPGFQAMIAEVEAGRVSTIIAKDLSRVGRNYLETGFYIEIMFPKKDVRFIAVNNGIDSASANENDFAPFLNIMNEFYARDCSSKIKSVFDARMKDGCRCSGSIPYGYYRVKGDKQTLTIDMEAAEVVKRIFLLANEGNSSGKIAEILTEENVLIPAAYAEKHHPEQSNGKKYTNAYLWNVSTVRAILNRKEYLGHTVLHKSAGTNFKLHKRRATTEKEQYVFLNTHESIISQELWDSVQERRKRANRASPRGTHHHRLCGFLFCADCGRQLTLQTHYAKKNKAVQYSFRCGGYASHINNCTGHTISATTLEAVLLDAVQCISRHVIKDEKALAEELQSMWLQKQAAKPKQDKSELKCLQKRYDDLSDLVRGLYENLVSGMLPERQYKQLMRQYDDEQAEIEEKITGIKETLDADETKPPDAQKFIAIIRKYTDPTEVSDVMLRELVDKIIVHEAEGKGNAKTQQIDIYFKYVGQISLASTEDELAQRAAREEQEQREQLARQRAREKHYREKRKAKKIAENGGELIAKKVCPCCGDEFVPTSNRQVFCSKDCRYVFAQNQKQEKRQAERSDHFYRQRNCMVCGKLFWPTHSQQSMCSDECRKKRHNAVTLEAYHTAKAAARNGGHPYGERVCEVCGKTFWPDGPNTKVCSNDCRLEKKRRESRVDYARKKKAQDNMGVAV